MDFMNSFEERSSYPEVILCKFGEVILKGNNRQNFESGLKISKEASRSKSEMRFVKTNFSSREFWAERDFRHVLQMRTDAFLQKSKKQLK